jgi:hypothetical protein
VGSDKRAVGLAKTSVDRILQESTELLFLAQFLARAPREQFVQREPVNHVGSFKRLLSEELQQPILCNPEKPGERLLAGPALERA